MKLKIERLRDFERDPSNNFLTRSEMMEAVKELIVLREAQKGDQVPVADAQSVATAIMQTIDAETDKFHSAYTLSELRIAIVKTLTGVFTAPQKPVVLDDATVLAWGDRNYIKGDVSKLRCMIDDAASLPAAIEAAGCIVKDGE